ncbi:MAG: hypothetical protein JXQ96_04040 [Cyclobacteriaceae bacterium]
MGITVVRFTNEEVKDSLHIVLEEIKKHLT